MKIQLADALKIVSDCEKKARETNVPVVITVVDGGCKTIAVHRMDNAPIGCIDVSACKANTAAALKIPTNVMAELCQPGQELYGMQFINGGEFIIFGGGFPLMDGTECIGGLGVSGGTVAEDTLIAEAGLNVFKQGV